MFEGNMRRAASGLYFRYTVDTNAFLNLVSLFLRLLVPILELVSLWQQVSHRRLPIDPFLHLDVESVDSCASNRLHPMIPSVPNHVSSSSCCMVGPSHLLTSQNLSYHTSGALYLLQAVFLTPCARAVIYLTVHSANSYRYKRSPLLPLTPAPLDASGLRYSH